MTGNDLPVQVFEFYLGWFSFVIPFFSRNNLNKQIFKRASLYCIYLNIKETADIFIRFENTNIFHFLIVSLVEKKSIEKILNII